MNEIDLNICKTCACYFPRNEKEISVLKSEFQSSVCSEKAKDDTCRFVEKLTCQIEATLQQRYK